MVKKFCHLWIIERKFTFIHQQNNNVKVGNYCCHGRPRRKRMTIWYILVDSLHTWPIMLFVRRKKGAFGISFSASNKRYCFTLKHFFFPLILVTSQQKKSTQSDQICRKDFSLRRKGVQDSGRSWGFIFWYLSFSLNNVAGCVMKTRGKWFHPSYIPSLTSDLQELLDLSKTITGGNNSF